MSGAGWAQFAVLGVLIAISTPLLGTYMYRVYFTRSAPGDRVFLPAERLVYRVCGIDPEGGQRWSTYALSLLTTRGDGADALRDERRLGQGIVLQHV